MYLIQAPRSTRLGFSIPALPAGEEELGAQGRAVARSWLSWHKEGAAQLEAQGTAAHRTPEGEKTQA